MKPMNVGKAIIAFWAMLAVASPVCCCFADVPASSGESTSHACCPTDESPLSSTQNQENPSHDCGCGDLAESSTVASAELFSSQQIFGAIAAPIPADQQIPVTHDGNTIRLITESPPPQRLFIVYQSFRL